MDGNLLSPLFPQSLGALFGVGMGGWLYSNTNTARCQEPAYLTPTALSSQVVSQHAFRAASALAQRGGAPGQFLARQHNNLQIQFVGVICLVNKIASLT